MKQGKLRTFSICLSDIPKERMLKSEKNGKYYINLQSWDYNQTDQYNNDFSVSILPTKQEQEAKKNGQQIQRIFIGNGRIWEDQSQPLHLTDKKSQQTQDDLPF